MAVQKLRLSYNIIQSMIVMDFKKRYFGTILGSFWAVLSPLISVFLIFFVLSFGIKSIPIKNVNFFFWLVLGMLPWFYISDGISNSCASFTDNRHLITKIKFPIFILPSIKLMSALIPHIFLLLIVLVILPFTSNNLSYLFWPQLIFYLICTLVLLHSLAFIAATVSVFIKDMTNIVQVCLQFLYWLTPIFWSPEFLPSKYQIILIVNPVNFIIQGYRDSIFFGIPFWHRGMELIAFILINFFLIIFASYFYKRLRPDFSDVL